MSLGSEAGTTRCQGGGREFLPKAHNPEELHFPEKTQESKHQKDEGETQTHSNDDTLPEDGAVAAWKPSSLILQKAIEIIKSQHFSKSLLPLHLPDILQHGAGAGGCATGTVS